MVVHICKCGKEMVLKRKSITIGTDIWNLYQHVWFWYQCPDWRVWNFWQHTAPIKVKETGD